MDWQAGKLAIARAINLDLTPQQEHYARLLRSEVRAGDRWLDIGCGTSICWIMSKKEQDLLVSSAAYVVGIDVDEGIVSNASVTYRVQAVGEQLPFQDETFHLVTANMVVEHVADPTRLLSEVLRVLRPGGRFLFITPNRLSPYFFVAHAMPENLKKGIVGFLEGRRGEEIFPTHYKINTPSTIAELALDNGFELQHISLVGSSGLLDRLGPVAWLECLFLKPLASWFHGKFQLEILAVLKKRSCAASLTVRPQWNS